MTTEEFENIMQDCGELKYYDDDNVVLGLNIIRKYLPKAGIEGADHDIIFSVLADTLVEAGITEEDAIMLRDLNWAVDDGGLRHFV